MRVFLSTLIIMGLLIGGCASDSSYELTPLEPNPDYGVLFAFYDCVKSQCLDDPKREQILRSWRSYVMRGTATYVPDMELYAIEFPSMDVDGFSEHWNYDMDYCGIQPLNTGALLSAIIYFCEDRDDPDESCQFWFDRLDEVLE